MLDNPFFSICIPTYNSVFFLKKLIKSLENQTFTNFEIIVSDDSTNDEVREYVALNGNISYQKRLNDGKATSNWNFALSKAKGKYKMLIHHDDYLYGDNTLESIYNDIILNRFPSIIFLGFKEESNKEKFFYRKFNFDNLLKYPNQLLYVNFLSTPSCVIMKDEVSELYDVNLKWIVDVEFYIRLITKYSNVLYLKSIKIIIGGDENKITNSITKNVILNEFYYLTKSEVFKYKIGLFYIKIKKIIIIIKHLLMSFFSI